MQGQFFKKHIACAKYHILNTWCFGSVCSLTSLLHNHMHLTSEGELSKFNETHWDLSVPRIKALVEQKLCMERIALV